MSPSEGPVAARVLAVGTDADVSAALHAHLEGAGYALTCVPSPGDLEVALRIATPQLILLLLPASPGAAWGAALTVTAAAARVGVRVVIVAPSREVVEPLAAVAGAERAIARAEVLARPAMVLERQPGTGGGLAQPATTPSVLVPPPPPAQAARPAEPASNPATRVGVDLLALIDEELVDEPRSRPQLTRVEVNVSLVSEHLFFVGSTRRIDSGGVFISTALPPPVGTRLQLRLGLPDGRKLDIEGEVLFVREKSAITGRQPSGCGVRLFGLPQWSVDAIDRFMQARPPIVYTAR